MQSVPVNDFHANALLHYFLQVNVLQSHLNKKKSIATFFGTKAGDAEDTVDK